MNPDNHIISSIVKKQSSPRCQIIFESGEFLYCSVDLAIKFNLGKGKVLDSHTIEKLIRAQKIMEIKQAAYYFATYKPRTEKQVRLKLKHKGYEDSEIDEAIVFLNEFKLLDDEKYAKSFVVNFLKKQPAGKQKLKTELLKKGVPNEIVFIVLNEDYPDDDKLEMAITSSMKKLRLLTNKTPEKRKSQLISFLKRQGFEWKIIKSVIENLESKNLL